MNHFSRKEKSGVTRGYIGVEVGEGGGAAVSGEEDLGDGRGQIRPTEWLKRVDTSMTFRRGVNSTCRM